jgi:hypothetical protein
MAQREIKGLFENIGIRFRMRRLIKTLLYDIKIITHECPDPLTSRIFD